MPIPAPIRDALAAAEMLLNEGQLLRAEEVCLQILSTDPQQAQALFYLGIIADRAGRYEMAVTYLHRASELNSSEPRFVHYLGDALFRLGQVDKAVASYRRTLELQPDSPLTCYNLANVLRDLQQFSEAEQLYRRAISSWPKLAEAFNNLGYVLERQNRYQEAIDCYRQAIHISPTLAEAHTNLGNATRAVQDFAQAQSAHQRVVELRPNDATAHLNLGNDLYSLGQIDAAIACFRRSLSLQPDFAEAFENLGIVLAEQEQPEEAMRCFHEALRRKPNSIVSLNSLGNLLNRSGNLDAAATFHQQALRVCPNNAEALVNLGYDLHCLGKLDAAIDCYQRAVEIQPTSAEAHSNLSAAYCDLGDYENARTHALQATVLNPELAIAHNNLGNVLKCFGQLSAAANSFRRSLSLRYSAETHSNLLLCLTYDSHLPQASVFQEHLRWAERNACDPSQWPAHSNTPDPMRRIRVGYVSGDFRQHAVAAFIEPIVRNHDRHQFEVFCYANNPFRDAVTERFQKNADHWRWTKGLSDGAVESLIRDDAIDILIDLSGHTAHNRLSVLAGKPSPIQATYVGYPATTGLAAIDYRFTDDVLSPPTESDYHVERLYRLPCGSAVFQPPADCPEVTELPALRHGYLTVRRPA